MTKEEKKLYQILNYLSQDEFFRPGINVNDQNIDSDKIIELPDPNSNDTIKFSKSYYGEIQGYGKIRIRVSEHGTYLDNWFRSNRNPHKSLQNVSIVISDKISTYSRSINRRYIRDEFGNRIFGYLFFVVEQYRYPFKNISFDDFKKIIRKLKNLNNPEINQYGVFTDPFKNNPSKRASRTILTPTDEDDNDLPIPSTPNRIHPRQLSVVNNQYFEIDKDGNVINEMEAINFGFFDDTEFFTKLYEDYNDKIEIEYPLRDFLENFIEEFNY